MVIFFNASRQVGDDTVNPRKNLMRTLPRSTRLAIATLYIRHRDARRQEERLRAKLGSNSPATQSAMTREIETHNALQAIISVVQNDLRFSTPAKFMEMTGRRGRVFARAA